MPSISETVTQQGLDFHERSIHIRFLFTMNKNTNLAAIQTATFKWEELLKRLTEALPSVTGNVLVQDTLPS